MLLALIITFATLILATVAWAMAALELARTAEVEAELRSEMADLKRIIRNTGNALIERDEHLRTIEMLLAEEQE